jgi:hypothetical protein
VAHDSGSWHMTRVNGSGTLHCQWQWHVALTQSLRGRKRPEQGPQRSQNHRRGSAEKYSEKVAMCQPNCHFLVILGPFSCHFVSFFVILSHFVSFLCHFCVILYNLKSFLCHFVSFLCHFMPFWTILAVYCILKSV